MAKLVVGVSLGDPHHDPIRENYTRAKARIEKTLKFLLGYSKDISGFWDEDFDLCIDMSDKILEDAKKAGAVVEGDKIEEWEIEPCDGSYEIWAQTRDDVEDYELVKLKKNTLAGVLAAADKIEEYEN